MNDHSLPQQESSLKNALIVDDGPIERLTGTAMLEQLGFFVIAAASAEQALQLLAERAIDLVLCDISMPGMDGLALLERTRNCTPPPLFIMSSTFDDAEHAVTALRSGAYGYLTKPLRFESLRATVTEAMAKYRDEQDMARRDALTHLMNKSEFARRLTQRLLVAPSGTECGALLLIKLHGLNHINHSYGRSEGDKVLQLAAATLSGLIRPVDLLARFSGDVFALHLDNITHTQVEERAAGISESVEGVKTVVAGEVFSLALVVGGACASAAMEIDDLFNRADFALHLVRERNRKRIHIYSEADEVHKHELSHQLNMLALARAVLNDRQRLHMHYQPIICLDTGKISHFEALLRLLDENGKPCNTGELVKTCEVFGLISRLDRAVVEVCLDHAAELPAGTCIAINLSGKSIGDPELLEFIETRIATLNIAPSCLIFELTETAAFYNLDEVQHFMRRIKSLGCRFALDDFGVGFSSFYYIKQLDFDYLKLDGSFIVNLPRNSSDQVFVHAMVEISKVFGLKVIAEWVEDRETADLLHRYGVAYGQGYYFGKPMPLPASIES